MTILATIDSSALATVVGGEQPAASLQTTQGLNDLESQIFRDCFRDGGSYIGCDRFAKHTKVFVEQGMGLARSGRVPASTTTTWKPWQDVVR